MKKLLRAARVIVQSALIIILVSGLILFGAIVGKAAWDAQQHGKTISGEKILHGLAEQGEFLGGHYSTMLSAINSCASHLYVIQSGAQLEERGY